MSKRNRITRAVIVETARHIIAKSGIGGLTFQALANHLGVTKQAVIYWYPTKAALARDLVLPVLAGESESLVAAVAAAKSPRQAIEGFVRTLVAFHLADLARFRLVYLAAQVDRDARDIVAGSEALEEVHRITGSAYSALEQALAPVAPDNARRLAVAIHMAGIGLVTMLALGSSIDDPLKHQGDAMVAALVDLLAGTALFDAA